ncbi:MAG: HAMP domain-containing histidine kinase [Proteobacteria bacterium]|nr:HAMP domain-containing histidine kinase [Pseudomonadota bacterium]
MNSVTSQSMRKAPGINHNCLLRRNVEIQPYGRCSVCTLQLKECHAWQSNGMSFALVVLILTLLLLPAGWPQQVLGIALLAVIVWQGLANHKRTDELIYGQHRLVGLTQELRGKQLIIEEQNNTLAAQVEARTAELHEANVRLAAANLELLELDKLRSALISNVSHELRTPLTGILGSAQNLRDGIAGGLTQPQCEYVQMIENDSGRLIRVVNELLDWGRLQAGHIRLECESIALQTVVDEVFMSVRAASEAMAVRLDQTGCDLSVQADPDKLRQILINLVDNAVKFSPRGSTVRVSARAGRDGLEVRVDDEGPGIEAVDLPKVFERFYRGRTSQATPGSGLGLAIARNLARLHGGDIAVQSQPGTGSSFMLRLPHMREEAMRKETVQ